MICAYFLNGEVDRLETMILHIIVWSLQFSLLLPFLSSNWEFLITVVGKKAFRFPLSSLRNWKGLEALLPHHQARNKGLMAP